MLLSDYYLQRYLFGLGHVKRFPGIRLRFRDICKNNDFKIRKKILKLPFLLSTKTLVTYQNSQNNIDKRYGK